MLPEVMISEIMSFAATGVKELVQVYGVVDWRWRGCGQSPLVHGKLSLTGELGVGSPVYKDVESEEDMVRVVGSVVTSVPGLTDLNIPWEKRKFIDTECLRVISTSCRFLKTLHLAVSNVGNWTDLEPLVSLEVLRLSRTTIDDAGLESVRQLTKLKVLSLRDTAISDEGLGRISSLTDLTKLFLGGTSISNAGLKFLKPLVNLKVLVLDRTAITEEGLSLLATSHPNLEWLCLSSNNMSDKGVVHLLKFTSLLTLDVESTQITEAQE